MRARLSRFFALLKKPYIRPAAAALSLLLLLGFTGTALLQHESLGWFAESKSVSANGMQVSPVKDGVTASFSYRRGMSGDFLSLPSPELPLNGLIPGEQIFFQVELTNSGERDERVTLSLILPEGGEVPLVKDGKYYYFGSQLRVSAVESTDATASASAYKSGACLVPNPEQAVFFDAAATPTDTVAAEGLLLPKNGGTLTITVTVEFHNSEESQNDYRGFGTSEVGGICRRMLDVTLAE